VFSAPLRFVTQNTTRRDSKCNQPIPINLQKKLGKRSPTSDIVKTAQQQQIETEHLMKSLLEQEGLANSILSKCGINLENYAIALNNSSSVSPKFQAAVVLSIWGAAWIRI